MVQQADKTEKKAPEKIASPTGTVGYYATLGLKFECSLSGDCLAPDACTLYPCLPPSSIFSPHHPESRGAALIRESGHPATPCADVQKRYKKLALQLHPDKVGDDPIHVDKFQAATTAYQVLSNESAQEAYWHMYRMRCYLFQVAHEVGQQLAPFYCFRVKKKDSNGLQQDRLLTADLREGFFQNWKKDKPHRKTELSQLKEVKQTGEMTFTVFFKAGRDYKLATESASCCRMYVSVLQTIATRKAWMSDDDAHFPPPR